MLNPNLHLNTRIFDRTAELKSIRAGFGQGMLEAAAKYTNVVALCADLCESVGLKPFKEKYPEKVKVYYVKKSFNRAIRYKRLLFCKKRLTIHPDNYFSDI